MKRLTKWALVAAAGVLGCGISDSVFVVLSSEGDSLSLAVGGDSTVVNADTTLVVRDTIVVIRYDTIFQPIDTVVITSVDTIVSGIDTTFATIFDTSFVYDTIVLTAVDTVIRYDTIVVTDTIQLPPPQLQFGVTNLTIDVGATRTVTVSLVNSLGFPIPTPPLSWLSDNTPVATVGATTGTMVGVSPGSARIYAFTGDGTSASLGLTVRDTTTVAPPPPPPVGGFAANAPAGLNTIVDCDFTQTWTGGSGTLNCGLGVTDWNRSTYPNDQCRTINDATSIFGGRAWESHYDDGPGGSGPCLLDRSLGTARDTVYVAMRVRYQSGWQGNTTDQKIIYVDTDTGAADGMFAYRYSAEAVHYVTSATGCEALEANVAVVGLKVPAESPPCQLQTAAYLTAGTWDVFEFMWICTTGTVKWWKNGLPRGSHTGRSIGCINNLRFPDTWGGGGTLTQEQSRFYDRIMIRASTN